MARHRVRNELELRVELARRRDEREQKIARSLCALDSAHCRAGDEWEWFDLSVGQRGRTYCFCPAHSLAAELALVNGSDIYASMSVEQFLDRVRELELERDTHRERRSG